MALRVGIVGASGYSGSVLASILASHPQVEVLFATSDKRGGESVAEALHPTGASLRELRFVPNASALELASGLVFERRLTHSSDRSATRLGRATVTVREMLKHVCKVAFATFIGAAIALDQPTTARQFKPKANMLACALNDSF